MFHLQMSLGNAFFKFRTIFIELFCYSNDEFFNDYELCTFLRTDLKEHILIHFNLKLVNYD